MNTPFSHKISKLLKIKGYIEPSYYYDSLGDIGSATKKTNWNESVNMLTTQVTISEAITWLYEKHSIWIYIEWQFGRNMWIYSIIDINSYENTIAIQEKNYKNVGEIEFVSPMDAYAEAIIYTLNEII